MTQKRIFPSNWSKFTDEQVLKNVKYLIANREKYHKYISAKGTIKIDNICILKAKNCYCINYHPVFLDTKPLEYYTIESLYNLCRDDLRPLDIRIKDWFKNNKADLRFWYVFILMMFVFISADFAFNKFYNNYYQDLKIIRRCIDSLNQKIK